MPTYFDVNTPVNSGGGTFALISCATCGGLVRNTEVARALHADWHDNPPKSAASGTVANSATIGIGATADIVVPLSRTMPNATYSAAPTLLAATATLLGTVSIVGVIAQSTTTVTIRVKNSGLSVLSAGALTVGVIAVP